MTDDSDASGTSSGFAKAKQQLADISNQTKWINEQASAGKLRMDPESAEDSATTCEKEQEELQDIAYEVQALAQTTPIGDYPDGNDLAKRFQQKALDPESGAFALLKQMTKELDKLADAFRGAAKDYRSTDEQAAEDFERGVRQ